MGLNVLITDHASSSLDIERDVLGAVGADLIVAQTGHEAELLALAPLAHAILTDWQNITPAVLDAAPLCRTVTRYGIAQDNIDIDYATRLGILVTHVPEACLDEVSDHTMALLLSCARGIVTYARSTRQGNWNLQVGKPLERLRGKTLGLVGYDSIVQTLIPKALSFGLDIIAYTPHVPYGRMTSFGMLTNNLDFLLSESDLVSLHVPLNAGTRGMINARALRQIKPTAYLINTSPSQVIDEAALYHALREGWIAGAALDGILEQSNPMTKLLELDNVIVTPQAAFYSEQAVQELKFRAATQVAQILDNRMPQNVLNPQVLDQANSRFGRPYHASLALLQPSVL
jgi:D-3-phosphoglycerate dehydrogenase